MASAYAALVSLTHTIEQITHHDRPPIQLDQNLIRSLGENVDFLKQFLEDYSHRDLAEAERLKNQITSSAHAAEDIIETHIVDQIHNGYTDLDLLWQGIQNVIQDMGLIKNEVMEMIERRRIENEHLPSSSIHVSPSNPLPVLHTMKNTIVDCDDSVTEIMDRIRGDQTNRQILPIVGMGGIGKTTLAKNVYDHPVIGQLFDVCAWVTISQKYSVREIISIILPQLENSYNIQKSGDKSEDKSEDELGEQLYKSLYGRRYFIVMDDMWNIEALDQIMRYFPDNGNGSRILVTTRLSIVAKQFSVDSYEMAFLDEKKSWNLLCKEVFGQEDCPLELEEIGKKIAKKCRGLPLSVVVVGGHLAKYEKMLEYWEYVLENLNAIVKLDDDEHCLKILSLSYDHLPIHLKPCFLYMGVFPEDDLIRVSKIVKLWVAEGFLKPKGSKILEKVAEEYLKDLIDRNLILVHQLGSLGNVKFCKIHDLLRELCIREAGNERFFYATSEHGVENLEYVRRICIYRSMPRDESFIGQIQVDHLLQSAPRARSLICDLDGVFLSLPFKLLRVLKMVDDAHSSFEGVLKLVNLRYIAFSCVQDLESTFPSICLLWNLQTLIINDFVHEIIAAPVEIWEMQQLRHLQLDSIFLPEPPSGLSKDFVLTNLQTLKRVVGFKCSKEVVDRIPNIKKMKISYEDFSDDNYSLTNLALLHKLESLSCIFSQPLYDMVHNFDFPHSLKKLTLYGSYLQWQEMTVIGSLPQLEVLKLHWNAFVGPEWIPYEGEFRRLKYLAIVWCSDLESWMADSTHFPCLEKLMLRSVRRLKEIPLDIGEIPTLRLIQLEHCGDSVVDSAKGILEELKYAGNEGWIQVKVLK